MQRSITQRLTNQVPQINHTSTRTIKRSSAAPQSPTQNQTQDHRFLNIIVQSACCPKSISGKSGIVGAEYLISKRSINSQ